MKLVSRPPRQYQVKHWPIIGAVTQVMPWTVVYIRPRLGSFPIMARCYTKHRATAICSALNQQRKG